MPNLSFSSTSVPFLVSMKPSASLRSFGRTAPALHRARSFFPSHAPSPMVFGRPAPSLSARQAPRPRPCLSPSPLAGVLPRSDHGVLLPRAFLCSSRPASLHGQARTDLLRARPPPLLLPAIRVSTALAIQLCCRAAPPAVLPCSARSFLFCPSSGHGCLGAVVAPARQHQ